MRPRLLRSRPWASAIDSSGGSSLSLMVPVAVVPSLASVAFTGLLSLTVKVSPSASSTVSFDRGHRDRLRRVSGVEGQRAAGRRVVAGLSCRAVLGGVRDLHLLPAGSHAHHE